MLLWSVCVSSPLLSSPLHSSPLFSSRPQLTTLLSSFLLHLSSISPLLCLELWAIFNNYSNKKAAVRKVKQYFIKMTERPVYETSTIFSTSVKTPASNSCIQLGTPLCRPLTGPGVQAEVSLSADPRVPWGSCTVEFHWPFGQTPTVSKLFQGTLYFMPEHAPLIPLALYKSDPPMAKLSGTRNWSWRGRGRGVR